MKLVQNSQSHTYFHLKCPCFPIQTSMWAEVSQAGTSQGTSRTCNRRGCLCQRQWGDIQRNSCDTALATTVLDVFGWSNWLLGWGTWPSSRIAQLEKILDVRMERISLSHIEDWEIGRWNHIGKKRWSGWWWANAKRIRSGWSITVSVAPSNNMKQ